MYGHTETVHSENYQSISGAAGNHNMNAYPEDGLLSLGSGGQIGEPTIVSQGGNAYISSGVLGGPL